MGTAERRYLILKVLCKRRYETIVNLAMEFGVSERTIQRDIDEISINEPIYTVQGRHGGVYVVDGYYAANNYLTQIQKDVLSKVIVFTEMQNNSILKEDEIVILKNILKDFTKPCVNE